MVQRQQKILITNKTKKMEKQTKILIGLAVLGAAAYLYFRPKGDATTTAPSNNCAEGEEQIFNSSTGKGFLCVKKCQEGYERERSIGGIGKCIQKVSNKTITKPKTCPDGSTLQQVNCIMAPCEPMCVENIFLVAE